MENMNNIFDYMNKQADSTSRFHSVNGAVYKPSDLRTIINVDIRQDDSVDHPSRMRLNVFAAFRALANTPFSKSKTNGTTCWVMTNMDDGVDFDPMINITNKQEEDEFLGGVRNTNMSNMLMFENHTVMNTLMIQDGTLSETLVCPGPQFPQETYENLNKLAMNLLTMYKYWDKFKTGKPYFSYSVGDVRQQPVRNERDMEKQFRETIKAYEAERNSLIKKGALITSSCIFVTNNSMFAIVRPIEGLKLGGGKKSDLYMNPRGFGLPNQPMSLRIVGEALVTDHETDPDHPDYDMGIGNTQDQHGGYKTQRYRRMGSFNTRNGSSVLARVTVFGNMSVGRGQASRPEIMASAIEERGNNVLIFKDGNILTFGSMYKRETDEGNEPWCVRPDITIGTYGLSKDDTELKLDKSELDEGIPVSSEVESDDNEDYEIPDFGLTIKPSDVTEREVHNSTIAAAKAERKAAMDRRNSKAKDEDGPSNALNDGLEDAPQFDPE